ncbi:60S ribosomal protein L7-like 1 [Saguinus oedipus]|uniref:60S ribosomal protein L7-like 1 n=1 Tax=Saguinus oedipus TaxID=9490 RepID=A0ABQ9ULH6_SAGOE|nr:60S ribosomal protein L7-like 1 [Saguinus oedipus]
MVGLHMISSCYTRKMEEQEQRKNPFGSRKSEKEEGLLSRQSHLGKAGTFGKEGAEERKRAQQKHDKVHVRRLEVKPHALELPDKHSLAFVICIERIDGVSLLVQRTIASLRLKKIFSGVFVKVTPQNLKMLRIVETYVTWEFPNLKSVQELILKHGQARVKNKTIPLTDNTVIEEHLGKFGGICLEDLIHEIAFLGKHFQEISWFLRPFHLSVARHATKNRVGFLKEMGTPGYRVECINQLIRQLN